MDAEAFRNFERAAHDRVAGGYHDFFEPMTGGAIMALLDAARVRAGCRVLYVATGPGGVAAAAAERGASRVIGADLSSRMVALAATLQAGAPPPPGLPAGPAVFRFSDETELLALLNAAGLEDVAASEVTWVHRVPSSEAWWHGGLGSLARASASILGQAPTMQRRIRAAFDRLVEPYAAEGGFRVPCAARVASGRKP
jgi:SAM-dependent methyltransferase